LAGSTIIDDSAAAKAAKVPKEIAGDGCDDAVALQRVLMPN